MELILISGSKLKVMMTEADMRFYMLDTDAADCNSEENRRAFQNILEEAKTRTGFDAAGDRVFVQVFPSRGGGCELYVTKLAKGEEPKEMYPENTQLPQTSPGEETPVSVRQLHMRNSVYRLTDVATLTALCRALRESGYEGPSSAFSGEHVGELYLVLSEPVSPRCRSTAAQCAGEFGEKLTFFAADAYVLEHCTPLCENGAVGVLAALA